MDHKSIGVSLAPPPPPLPPIRGNHHSEPQAQVFRLWEDAELAYIGGYLGDNGEEHGHYYNGVI